MNAVTKFNKWYRKTVITLVETLIVGVAFYGTLWICGAVAETVAHLLGV